MRLRTSVLALCLVAIFAVAAVGPVSAHEYDRNDSDNPWRLVGYVLHPVGVALEYTITRPIHALVHRPGWSYMLGHDPNPARARIVCDEPERKSPKPVELKASASEPEDADEAQAVGQAEEKDATTPDALQVASADTTQAE